jgi:hypothetical protein
LLKLIDACSEWAPLDIGVDRGAFKSGQGLGPTRNLCESIARRAMRWVYTTQVIIATHVLLYFFDSLPLAHLVFSIICHMVYLQNFTPAWPLISLSSLTFISSCILVVSDHFMWFFYFSRLTSQARTARGRMYRGPNSGVPGFSDIATFFALCVWLAPLFLFLSLSAGEGQIYIGLAGVPSTPSTPPRIQPPQLRGSLFKTLVDALPLNYLPRMRSVTSRNSPEGIIAPPLKSPSLHPDGPPSPYMRTLNDLPPSPGIPRQPSDMLSPGFQLAPPPRRFSNSSMMAGASSSRLNIRRATMPVNGFDQDS